MQAEIRRVIETDHITKLLLAGRTITEISGWLNIDEAVVQRVRTAITGHDSKFDGVVHISQSGRGGTISYILQEKKLDFHWEFGGGNTLALIFVPDQDTWEAQTGMPSSSRIEFLTFIAEQVIRQKASGHGFRIQDDVIAIIPATS
jgi:hypothetical protein